MKSINQLFNAILLGSKQLDFFMYLTSIYHVSIYRAIPFTMNFGLVPGCIDYLALKESNNTS